METNVLVSIIVPVYNAGEYLRPCLDTLVNQTMREIEIVCVLDMPTDGSDKVVEEYASKDNRIVIIYNKNNLHIGETRNVGLQVARGEYVGFSDHDDTHELDMYEKLYLSACDTSAEVVFSGKMAEYLSSFESPVSVVEAYLAFLSRKKTTHVTPNLYKKRFLIENGIRFVDTKQYSIEDTLFNVLLLSKLRKKNGIAIHNHYYYKHVLTKNNTSRGINHWRFEKVLRSVQYAINVTEAQDWLPEDRCKEAVRMRCVKSFYTSFLREIKLIGLLKTIDLFNNIKNDSNIVKYFTPPYQEEERLSLAKRAFAQYLKWICKS